VSTLVTFALSLALIGQPGSVTAAPGSPATVTEFPLPHANSRPYTIVTGPDGNLWFTESTRSTIGRITPTGTITEWHTPDDGTGPYGLTLGSDGNLWFTERFANRIGKITTSGTITEYDLPTPNAQP
jgi:streptogramin lyase